jgi:presenilin 1
MASSERVSPPAEMEPPALNTRDRPGYGLDHLSAVIRPVALTMILSSLAVAWIRDPEQDQAIASGLSNYLVYSSGPSSPSSESTSVDVGRALINAIVIVAVVACATFVLVACYYFRCLKLMLGYLIFASVNLLGYTGSFMVMSGVTINKSVR